MGSAGETSPVDLEDGVLGDNAASAIPAVWVGDSVTITPHQLATVSIDAPDQVFVDSNFTALVRISDVTNFDAANYDVVFDPNVLRTADVSPGLIGGTVVPVDTWIEVEPGRIRIIQNIPGVDGTTGVGYLAGVSFLVVGGEGATGDIAMKDMVLGDTESRPIPSQTVGHTLSVIVPVDPLLCTSPFPPSFDFGELNRGELGQESFELTNCGTGTLDWTVSANQPWISLNPSQGTTTAETETVVVTADTSTLQGGQTHTSTITVSSNGGAVEGTISVTVIALPTDLTVIDLDVTPPGFQDGDTVTLTATVENTGDGAIFDDFHVAFKVGDIKIGSQRVRDGLVAGGQVQLNQLWEVSPGTHTVTVIADELAVIGESNEDNNELVEILPDVPFSDLIVSDISWTPPANIDDGEEVTFTATVVNTGEGGTSRDFHVFFELDGAFIGQSIVSGLASGASVQVDQNWTATLGDHNIRAFVDRFDAVPESTEGNNDRVEVLPLIGAPDLVVSQIIASPPDTIVDGQQVAIAASVTNAGSGDLPGNFLVRFEIDDTFLTEELVVGGLSIGESVVITADWAAQVGVHTATVIADSEATVTETDEANNSLSLQLPEVPASDLIVLDIDFDPSEGIFDGQEVSIIATVENTGDGNTLRDFSVRFEVDGVPIGNRLVAGGLSTGEQVSVSQVWTSEGGIHTARVVVDDANAVTESDEANNQLIEQLPEVVAPDLIVIELTWAPTAEFNDGEQIPVFATLHNTGSGATLRDFSVRFEIDGVFIGSHVVTGGLTAGQSKVASQVWTSQVGIHVLTATVDETNAIEEADENNNTLSLALPDVPATDLVLISLTWAPPAEIIDVEEVVFTATVKNISENSTSRDFNVRFEIDNGFIGQTRITGDFPAGQERQATLTWTARVGLHEVKAIADHDQEVTESNESNNERIETLPNIPAIDLDVTSITWVPVEGIIVGEEVILIPS